MVNNLWVKICGITRLEDALEAESLGADAVGFIFYRESRRFIEPADAARIIAALRPETAKVGVFVDETAAYVRKVFHDIGLTMAQLHGAETPWNVGELEDLPVVKAFRLKQGFSPGCLRDYNSAHSYLLDTFVPGRYGGTGKPFDWIIARSCRKHGRIIVAGGITPENVSEAVRIAQSWGIDISSGVESSPGIKDSEKMRALFKALKRSRESE